MQPAQRSIIFLTGPSSAGKSTLAAALQRAMDQPFMRLSSDHLAQGLDTRRSEQGPFAYWHSVRPRFFSGFHRSIAAFANAGNDLIVDHLIEFEAWRAELAALLGHHDVFLIGVTCSLGELTRREQARGDRRIGEAHEHVLIDRVGEIAQPDLLLDTTDQTTETLVAQVLSAWAGRSPARAMLRVWKS
jgi:chloramphenicol 3-O phosphotransferase